MAKFVENGNCMGSTNLEWRNDGVAMKNFSNKIVTITMIIVMIKILVVGICYPSY